MTGGLLEEKLSYSDYVGLKPVEDSAIPPTGLEPCKRREKKSNDLCQIPKYRISKISKKNLRECVYSSSVSLSKLSRGNTIFFLENMHDSQAKQIRFFFT